MITISIDYDKIDQSRLFKGAKGNYLDLVLIERNDQYGNNFMVVESVSKEEREQGIRGAILGNGKTIVRRDPTNFNTPPDELIDNSGNNGPDNLGL